MSTETATSVIFASFADDSVNVLLGNGSGVTKSVGLSRLTGVSVDTQVNALSAQNTIASFLTDVNSFVGTIGAFAARIETAKAALAIRRENYLSASAQISDADFAEETAKLVKARILQQAGSVVLSQAYQLPALALRLLEPE
jgi:flagellin